MRGDPDNNLLDYIVRIERLNIEKKKIRAATKEVFNEAKTLGLEPKLMRQIIRMRELNPDIFREEEIMLYHYKKAVDLLVVASEVGEE